MLRYRPDIEIRDEEGRVIAIVEVKGQATRTGEQAAQVRRNVLAHAAVSRVPYFAVVTPTTGFIWRTVASDESDPGDQRLPDEVFSTESMIDRYLPGPISSRIRNGSQLELVVYQWLNELTHGVP